ncbi:S46 family peptidase [Methylocystis heyeri]|nr:S46 family peptidase [Methylocystis heyeri]
MADRQLDVPFAINRQRRCGSVLGASVALTLCAAPLRADEGFWLYSQAPLQHIVEKYRVQLTPEWLDHMEKATVRFNSKRYDAYVGGSGSFVSADGLVLTNRHVIPLSILAKAETAGGNIQRDGFVAQSLEEETKLPGVSLDAVLSSMDVTTLVNERIPATATDADAERIRKETIAELERAGSTTPGTEAEVVSLDAGARYMLYTHRRYSDVRLVFAPEAAAAQRMEDHPAPAFDVALVRAYENGVPARPDQHLQMSARAPTEGELAFVLGVPTRSNRRLTVAALEAQRDIELPLWLEAFTKLQLRLAAFAAHDADSARAAAPALVNVAFVRRITEGRLAALRDDTFLAKRREKELELTGSLAAHGDDNSIEAYRNIARIAPRRARRAFRNELLFPTASSPWPREDVVLPFGLDYASSLHAFGEVLLKSRNQRDLTDAERSRGYRAKDRGDLENWLFNATKPDPRVEELRLQAFFDTLVESLGADDPFVQIALDGESSQQRAASLASGTHLDDVGFRRALYNMSNESFDATPDAYLEMLRSLEHKRRDLNDADVVDDALFEREEERMRRATAMALGGALYPDATRTARIAFGTVQGWRGSGGTVPYATMIGAFFDQPKADVSERSATPLRWARAAERVEKGTMLDFVSTADVVAGNSGSATVDTKGRLIGIVFGPGAVEGATAVDFAYGATVSQRAAHVAAAAIFEALAHVYDAPRLVGELKDGHR